MNAPDPADPLRSEAGWPARAMAFGRLLTFMATVVVFFTGWFTLMVKLTGLHGDPTSLAQFLILESTLVVVTVTAGAVMMLMWRLPLADFGLGRLDRAGRELAIGAAAGLGLMAALTGVLWMLGAVSFSGLLLTPAQIAINGAGYLLLFVLTAVAEQGLFRAFALTQLSRAVTFWPAAAILAVIFGILHLGNDGESMAGAMMAGVFGLICAWSFRISGALWFALGFHAAWDFAETFLFGVPNSGNVSPGALVHATMHGPVLLSGGTAGPEGSLLAMIAMVLMALVAWFTLGRRGQTPGGPAA